MTNTTKIQRTIKEYHEQLHANKLNNVKENDKFLESYNLSRLNQEGIENLNRPVTSNEIRQYQKIPNKQKTRNRQLHRRIQPHI